MSTPKAPFELPKRRFSKKALNCIIIAVAIMIFVLAQTGKENKPDAPAVASTEQSTNSPVDHAKAAEALIALRDKIKAAPEDSVHVDIQRWEHPSGAQLLFVASPELPMVNMELIFDAGSSRDGKTPGLARLTSSLLGEGSKNYTVDEIAVGFESLGSEFTTASERDMGVVKLKTLSASAHLEPSLNLFIEVISTPSFPEVSFSRIRKTMLLSLEQEKASPRKLISKATWAALYPNHPYSNYPAGTPKSLESLTIKDLKQFHQGHYTAANMVIAIVGAIDTNKAKEITERIVKALPTGEKLPKLPEAKLPATLDPVHIDYPSQQTHIRIATLSVARKDPDLIPLRLANEVLGGGGFTSQLSKVIRQENGLAYSVYSHPAAMRDRGIFLVDLQTQNDSATKALKLTQETIDAFLKAGPSAEALQKARSHMVASFPLGFGTNSSILGQLGAMGFYNLPTDYFDRYIPTLMDITGETAQTTFNKIVGQQQHVVITLGPEPISTATH